MNSSRFASTHFAKMGKKDMINTNEPVVYVTNINQLNADLPDYNP